VPSNSTTAANESISTACKQHHTHKLSTLQQPTQPSDNDTRISAIAAWLAFEKIKSVTHLVEWPSQPAIHIQMLCHKLNCPKLPPSAAAAAAALPLVFSLPWRCRKLPLCSPCSRTCRGHHFSSVCINMQHRLAHNTCTSADVAVRTSAALTHTQRPRG